MAYSVQDIANWILLRNKCEEAMEGGDFISNLKLQKLLYYAQGSYLALKDEPLFNEEIEAWTYGPVVPEVYHKFKGYGSNGIDTSEISMELNQIDDEAKKILEEVYDVFGQYSASKLVKMTHEEAPWKNTQKNCVIDKDLIKKYFKENYLES